jgi:hypothetical protein
VLSDGRGTLVIRWYEWQHNNGELFDLWLHGGWYLCNATGAYAGTTGHGWFSDHNFIFGDAFVITLRGDLG